MLGDADGLTDRILDGSTDGTTLLTPRWPVCHSDQRLKTRMDCSLEYQKTVVVKQEDLVPAAALREPDRETVRISARSDGWGHRGNN